MEQLPSLVRRARAYQMVSSAVGQWDHPEQAAALLLQAWEHDQRNLEIGSLLAAAQERAGQGAASLRTQSQLNSQLSCDLLTRIHDSGWLDIPDVVRAAQQ